MGEHSKIEWTDHTFNPWWGCVRVSPACQHCYAETFSKRVGLDVWGVGESRRFFGAKHWQEPRKWNAAAQRAGVRARVFCASMADVFEDRADLVQPRADLFVLIDDTPWLDWLLLTKRPEHIERLMPAYWGNGVWPNVWLGATVEDSLRESRIEALRSAPAVVRFLSCEPLLASVAPNLAGIQWVICGGESGHGARPMRVEWARSLRDRCVDAGVAFHFKQWGEHNAQGVRVGKKAAGRLLDGREWNEFPQRSPDMATKDAGTHENDMAKNGASLGDD